MILPPDVLPTTALFVQLLSCPVAPVVDVSVQFKNKSPAYILDRSSAELGRFKIDTTFSHGQNEIFITGGLTESIILTGLAFEYGTLTSHSQQHACIWLTKAIVTVTYAPRVYIANDFKKESCRYAETDKHELRHVNTDVITIKEYIPRMEKSLRNVASILKTQTPIAKNKLKRAKELLVSVMRTEMQKQMLEMNRVRTLRQQQIDTRQEYLAQSAACPDEPVRR